MRSKGNLINDSSSRVIKDHTLKKIKNNGGCLTEKSFQLLAHMRGFVASNDWGGGLAGVNS